MPKVFCQTSWHDPRGLSTLYSKRFTESNFRTDRTGAVLQLDLVGLQRLLHPSWAQESAGHMRKKVSSSIFVTLGCCQLSGSCHFAHPQSESVFVFDCLRLHLPLPSSLWGVVSCQGAATLLIPRVSLSSSLSVSVFIYLCLHHSGVLSAVRELQLHWSTEWVCFHLPLSQSLSIPVFAHLCLQLSSSVSVTVPGGWSRGCRPCLMFYIKGLGTTMACVF